MPLLPTIDDAISFVRDICGIYWVLDDVLEDLAKYAMQSPYRRDDTSVRLVIALRNAAAECFPAPFGSLVDPWLEFECDTARFHVFFMNIPETPEMLLRLCGETPVMTGRVARSKIGATQLAIHPIDGTASAVAPTEPTELLGPS